MWRAPSRAERAAWAPPAARGAARARHAPASLRCFPSTSPAPPSLSLSCNLSAGKEEEERNALLEEIAYLRDTKGAIPGLPERERRTRIRSLMREAAARKAAGDSSARTYRIDAPHDAARPHVEPPAREFRRSA